MRNSFIEQVFDVLCNNMSYSGRFEFFLKYDIEFNGDKQTIDFYDSRDSLADRGEPLYRLTLK